MLMLCGQILLLYVSTILIMCLLVRYPAKNAKLKSEVEAIKMIMAIGMALPPLGILFSVIYIFYNLADMIVEDARKGEVYD